MSSSDTEIELPSRKYPIQLKLTIGLILMILGCSNIIKVSGNLAIEASEVEEIKKVRGDQRKME